MRSRRVVAAVAACVLATACATSAERTEWGWRPADVAADWTPPFDAGWVGGQWWGLDEKPDLAGVEAVPPPPFAFGDVVAWSAADLDGDGGLEYIVSYRHPLREVAWDPAPQETDAGGRTAHLGVIDASGNALWLAHRIPHPIAVIAACGSGAIALGYSTMEDDQVIGATAAVWNGFGFTLAPEIPGPARVGCADVDGDRVLDPVLSRGTVR